MPELTEWQQGYFLGFGIGILCGLHAMHQFISIRKQLAAQRAHAQKEQSNG